MKIFNKEDKWETKVNFVDENNVMLGYDLTQNCCEYAGWFISDRIETVIIESFDLEEEELEGFVFDPDFMIESDIDETYDEGRFAIFSIVNGERRYYIHLYNVHNGYYSHGFKFNEKVGYL